MDDLKSVLDDADSHKLLAVVSSVHHQRIGQTLYDGALRKIKASFRMMNIQSKEWIDHNDRLKKARIGPALETYLSLSKPFGGISSGRVREIFGELFLDGDVIGQ